MIIKLISGLLLGLLFVTGCSKKEELADCTGLRTAIITDDVTGGMAALTSFVQRLPTREYSDNNLGRLVELINSNCSVMAEKLCFSCIQTLPEQSEISIRFLNNGSDVHKIFDLSHPVGGSQMIVLNMHQ